MGLQAGAEETGITKLPWAHLRLPPFPQVAIRVLQLANNENVPLHQLCELISSDPAFASEVLTVANSALYSPRYPANSILQAVAVLGANTLHGMCITVGVRAYLGKAMSHPSMRALWRHNLACATIAQRIAGAGFLDKDTAFTSGILHDIGRVGLAVIQPKEYGRMLAFHEGPPSAILASERNLFGWDHCEAGRQLIKSWNLPPELDAVVTDHHCARHPEGEWSIPELVKTSCRMADAAGYSAFAGCETTPYGELLDELPARERRLFFPDLESLTADVKKNISAVEST
jgi:HD-like signal output (HDOD) protein